MRNDPLAETQLLREAAAYDRPGSREYGNLTPVPVAPSSSWARAKAAEDRECARAVARHTMLDAHGCTGQGCRKRAHGRDREARDELLDMLDLTGAPPAPDPHTDDWGRRRKAGSKPGEHSPQEPDDPLGDELEAAGRMYARPCDLPET